MCTFTMRVSENARGSKKTHGLSSSRALLGMFMLICAHDASGAWTREEPIDVCLSLPNQDYIKGERGKTRPNIKSYGHVDVHPPFPHCL